MAGAVGFKVVGNMPTTVTQTGTCLKRIDSSKLETGTLRTPSNLFLSLATRQPVSRGVELYGGAAKHRLNDAELFQKTFSINYCAHNSH